MGDNKPDKSSIKRVLSRAVNNKQWELVTLICLLEGDNRPDFENIKSACEQLAQNNQVDNIVQIGRLYPEVIQPTVIISELEPEPELSEQCETTVQANPSTQVTVELERKDIDAVKKQIARLRNNTKFGIKNTWKADKIEEALQNAIDNKVEDVRCDEDVRAALALHRIFGFFGLKTATALKEIDKTKEIDNQNGPQIK